MDNWGDPWADNADKTKFPTKSEVTSPLPPTFAPAPALLNGILDDAGWGNDDDDFGDWSSAPAKEGADAAPAQPIITEPHAVHDPLQPTEDAQWDLGAGLDNHVAHDDGGWAEVNMEASKEHEQVVSETSDSSTTIQTNEPTEASSTAVHIRLQPEDDSSARASTSPSETSHNDVPVESPRTS
ncbi:hypothetical protein EK21DRAFT_21097, partial [Setomelanomma holmii]